MGKEVGIKASEFETNISTVKSNAEEISSDMSVMDEFEKTNIKPFTTDIKNVIKAKELLDKYKELIMKDIEILDETGQDMIENDEQLGKENETVEMK